jgi:hypothetical protein
LRRAPPVVWLALAFVGGAACGLAGAPWFVAPLAAPLLLFRPKATSRRPVRGSALLASAACGLLAAHPGVAGCPSPARPLGTPVAIEGRFLVSPRGGSGPFRALGSCSDVTAVVPRQIVPPDAALRVRLKGRWVEGRAGPWLRVAEVEPAQGASPGPEWSWWPVRWRDHLVERLGRLYGERAPLVAALTLARREGLDGELRESFARSGIAHLLAISGFHVGVIAGGALLGLALCGVPRRPPRAPTWPSSASRTPLAGPP